MSNLNYQIRPSKHVERKIFIETLQHLRSIGYDIPTYHYVGFGHYYFVDFILFHRLLSIDKMTSVEKRNGIEKRVEFNKPYKFIDIEMADFAHYVSRIRGNEKYFIWLDYECQLDSDILASIGSLVNTLQNGSILIVTVNAEPSLARNTMVNGKDMGEAIKKQQEGVLQTNCDTELSPYCGVVKKADITPGGMPNLFARTLNAKILDSIKGRTGDSFFQLFNYVYKDGSQMLTFGGVIDTTGQKAAIDELAAKYDFINTSANSMKINIPQLTIREKLYLDKKIASNQKIKGKLAFEISQDEIDSYAQFAKHYPTFHEVLMG